MCVPTWMLVVVMVALGCVPTPPQARASTSTGYEDWLEEHQCHEMLERSGKHPPGGCEDTCVALRPAPEQAQPAQTELQTAYEAAVRSRRKADAKAQLQSGLDGIAFQRHFEPRPVKETPEERWLRHLEAISAQCCKRCDGIGQPCGDSCIALEKTCHKGIGCACW